VLLLVSEGKKKKIWSMQQEVNEKKLLLPPNKRVPHGHQLLLFFGRIIMKIKSLQGISMY